MGIHHSDRGSQYAANEFRKLLAAKQLRQSMSRKGNCWDNAPTESFFHTLKTEHIYFESFATKEEAREKSLKTAGKPPPPVSGKALGS
ncbi:MAG: DDE-type integrase/transposase/recombinase [Bdellovibrionales bacterium]|nr:DDE-type integrase/transposase/recombinase [Bdellovibrionales bacterium]